MAARNHPLAPPANRSDAVSRPLLLALKGEDGGYLGLIVGFANDGIAGVPGVLRVNVESEAGKVLKSGCLNAGYPLPGKIRQAQFVLPQGTRNTMERPQTESRARGEGDALSRALGVSPETK